MAVTVEPTREVTVDQLLKSSVLASQQVLAGKAGLSRLVRNVTVLSEPDTDIWLKGGEFVLTNGYFFKDSPEQLIAMIKAFAGKGCAAIGIKLGRFIEGVDPDALAACDEANLPLVTLPRDLAWSDIIMGLHGGLDVGDNLYHEMISVCLFSHRDRPFGAIRVLVERLTSLFPVQMAVLDSGGSIVAASTGIAKTLASLDGPERTAVSTEALPLGAGLGQLIIEPSVYDHTELGQLIPLMRNLCANLLSLAEMRRKVRLARSNSIKVMMRDNGSVDLDVLTLKPGEPVRAVVLGHYDEKDPVDEPTAEEFETTMGGPTARIEDALLCFTRNDSICDLAAVLEDFTSRTPDHPCVCGVSRPTDPHNIIVAIKEALLALHACRTLSMPERGVLTYEELGIATLQSAHLFASDLSLVIDDLSKRFSAFGPSEEEYLRTLEVYLQSEGSITECSKILHIHPSTMKYRLARIRRIVSMGSFEEKVKLYLALQLRRLSRTVEEKIPRKERTVT